MEPLNIEDPSKKVMVVQISRPRFIMLWAFVFSFSLLASIVTLCLAYRETKVVSNEDQHEIYLPKLHDIEQRLEILENANETEKSASTVSSNDDTNLEMDLKALQISLDELEEKLFKNNESYSESLYSIEKLKSEIQKYKNENEILLDRLNHQVTDNSEAVWSLQKSQINSIFASKLLDLTGIFRLHSYFEETGLHPKNISLKFRASEYSYSAAAFHNYCDNIGPTLTVVKSETGHVLGGFTRSSWTDQDTILAGSDDDFIFSLNYKDKMSVVDYGSAVSNSLRSSPEFGPQFGQNPELKIGDNCREEASCASIADESNSMYETPEGITTLVPGTDDGVHFKCLDYEVFSVQF